MSVGLREILGLLVGFWAQNCGSWNVSSGLRVKVPPRKGGLTRVEWGLQLPTNYWRLLFQVVCSSISTFIIIQSRQGWNFGLE